MVVSPFVGQLEIASEDRGQRGGVVSIDGQSAAPLRAVQSKGADDDEPSGSNGFLQPVNVGRLISRISQEMKRSPVVPQMISSGWFPGSDIGSDPFDAGAFIAETLLGRVKCGFGKVQHRNLSDFAFDKTIDESGGATSNIDDRRAGGDSRQCYQFERRRWIFLEPAYLPFAFCGVNVLPMSFSADIAHDCLLLFPATDQGSIKMVTPPILDNKSTSSPSVFLPSALLREARRQKNLATMQVPPVCMLDPDGDIVRTLREMGQTKPFAAWPCYHTELDTFSFAGQEVGIVGRVVGASFAVLVAEELFASGCRLLVSLTSAGQIVASGSPPYFVIVDRALRDEGTSYHYAPPAEFAAADPWLVENAAKATSKSTPRVVVGATWTTDAPFRETAESIEAARSKGILGVEMEAAALYAFARSAGVPLLCLAHVTNTMGQGGMDFEKGHADGTSDALAVLESVVAALHPSPSTAGNSEQINT
jgi:uridine phosphorylase